MDNAEIGIVILLLYGVGYGSVVKHFVPKKMGEHSSLAKYFCLSSLIIIIDRKVNFVRLNFSFITM